MTPLREFKEFIEKGIIKRQLPDISRAKSLVEESEKRKAFLKKMLQKIPISEENASYFVENVYDILIELIRAKLLINGFKSTGRHSHEAEISYLRKLGFPESEISFMNDLRYFRNGIKYYGESLDEDYAGRALRFLERFYPKLRKSIKK